MRVLTLAELSFVAGGDYGSGGDDGGDIIVNGNPDNGGDDTGGDYTPDIGGDDTGDSGGVGASSPASNNDQLHQQEKGHFQIQGDEGKYYYRDQEGHLQLQPQYQQQIDNSHIDWKGVAIDGAIIVFGAIGAAGDAVLGAIGVVGGSGSAAAYELHGGK